MTSQPGNAPIFIERDQPLSDLKHVFQEVASRNHTRVLLVKGDFGIGKTRLVQTFISRLKAENKNVSVGQAQCALETQQNGLVPFKDIVVDLANNEPRVKQVLGSVGNFLKDVAPAWADMVTAGTASLLIEAVSQTIKYKKETGISKYTQDNVYAQFANLIKKLSEKNPILLFIDDIQWADESSLGLITYISRVISDKPILIIATYREADVIERDDFSEFSTCIANLIRYGARQIELSQGINTGEYVKIRYPQNNFVVEVINKIEQVSEGHPLFLDELFTYWEQLGLIYETNVDGQTLWTMKEDISVQEVLLNIPSSVTSILKNRLQLMEKDLREVVLGAAVEGFSFTAQVVAELRSIEIDDLFDSLAALENNYYLLRRDKDLETNDTVLDLYKFIKAFYREYIYSQMDPGKRRLLHRKVAELLERFYGDSTYTIGSKLMYHYKEARDYGRAVKYSIAGARFEQINYGWSEAEKICIEGLSLCNRLTEAQGKSQSIFELLKVSARSLYISGNVKKAHARYQEISDLIPSLNISVEDHLAFLLDFIDACEDSNFISEAITYINKAEELINAHHYTGKYQKQYVVYKSWELIRTGQNAKAVELLKGLVADIEGKAEHERTLSQAYNSLGIAISNLGDVGSSEYLKKSALLSEKLGDRKTEIVALLNLADDLLYYGVLSEAVQYNEKALKLAANIGDRDGEAYGLANQGRIELMQNNLDIAIQLLLKSMLILDEIGSDWNKSFVLADLAVGYALLNYHALAFEKIQQAENYLEADPFRTAYLTRANARVLFKAGKPAEGQALYKEAVEICEKIGDTNFRNETLKELADELEKAGKVTEAEQVRSMIL